MSDNPIRISSTAGHTKYTDAEAVAAIEAETTLEFDAAITISTVTGNLTLNPSGTLTFTPSSGNVNFSGNNVFNVNAITGQASAEIVIQANLTTSDAAAQRVVLNTLDTGGNARILVAYAEPTATETTPFWAQRADVTTPLTSSLDASFLTFRWTPGDDVVTVFVNDGGTIRSVAIGTVV